MQRNSSRALPVFLGALAVLGSITTYAFAHATLVSAEPAPDSEVTAPKVIQLHFSEAFEPKFSHFKLTDLDGAEVKIQPTEAKDAKTLAAMPTAPLEPGLYTVSWTTIGHDSHKRTGTFSFSVK